jgi:hypothetical protein
MLSRVVDDDDGSWRTYVSEDCTSSYLRQGLATERLGAQRNGEMCVCVCVSIFSHTISLSDVLLQAFLIN